MRQRHWTASAIALLGLSAPSTAHKTFSNYSVAESPQSLFSIYGDRPDGCPPCFNCNLEDFKCHQFAECSKANGRCSCGPGFGGEDCSEPLCGSLADGKDRAPRGSEKECNCKDGWSGINCNVCETNDACSAMMPDGEGGVCYKDGQLVKQNFQMCDITNRKILDTLKDKKPQATFSCNAETDECNFQFWVDQRESFYCALDTCSSEWTAESDRNLTKYRCENIKCACVPGRMLCGESGSIDIGEFLTGEIKGPAEFRSVASVNSKESMSLFSEPAMNDLISSVFGDESIFLKCDTGECLYQTEVPGYERPIKKINTPLIAGVIAGCALFIVAVILTIWYLTHRAESRRYSGYFHLSDDEEDENAKLLADHKPAALLFENVGYNLNGKQILSGISGAVHPGELLAIMGASGAGKTTFLDILARKNKIGITSGDFYLNGERVRDDEFRNVIGFVDQEDTLLPTLTVHETILDSALLRLPKEMSRMAKEQKVEDVERQLGIHHIRNQKIGSEESGRGISGGEKRRVGIACELVTSPSILFLDEPTSGLDAFNAFNVVECLVNLVKNYNRTVVVTIHQPRSNIVALFDQLLLLAKGRTVYSGPFDNCQNYFDNIGYTCPPGFNIADYLIDLTMHASAARHIIDDDSSLFTRDGLHTSASSAIAVKSIPSINTSELDRDMAGSPSNSSTRPRNKRRTSIRQQQERELFTRKKSANLVDGTMSPKTDDEAPYDRRSAIKAQWLKLTRQQGGVPAQILEDPDELPPPANGGTGTNLDILINAYSSSDVAASIREDIATSITNANQANGSSGGEANGFVAAGKLKGFKKVGLLGQFKILSLRTWRNLYRNPMLMLTHYAIAIVLAVFLGFLFYGLTDDIKGFQNRLGLFLFVLSLFGFSSLTILTVFAPERLLFTRERAKGYYSPPSYFAAKVLFDIIPLRLLPPLILGVVVYPMTGLIPAWPNFLKFELFLVLFNLAAAAIFLFIGIVFRNSGVANLIGVLVMLFSLLFSGFFLNKESIPPIALWLQSLSIFHYAFEGLIVNEVKYLSLIDHKYGLDIEVPGSAILSSFGFNVQALWTDVVGLAVFGGAFVILAYLAMHLLLVEKR
ncbi:hypothetical protein IQ07DRAFT_582119 [Pyrenochaeta sp. DS3sAY3a]|nr:hypothetical protein IQ07DRAFT_582119 [Pyrenochaeta sp. DS3sAY3a]